VNDSSLAPLAFPAKDGALALDEVQLEGKRRMTAAEFVRGYPGELRLA
jgi:methionyl-tRNA formyltransferase